MPARSRGRSAALRRIDAALRRVAKDANRKIGICVFSTLHGYISNKDAAFRAAHPLGRITEP